MVAHPIIKDERENTCRHGESVALSLRTHHKHQDVQPKIETLTIGRVLKSEKYATRITTSKKRTTEINDITQEIIDKYHIYAQHENIGSNIS